MLAAQLSVTNVAHLESLLECDLQQQLLADDLTAAYQQEHQQAECVQQLAVTDGEQLGDFKTPFLISLNLFFEIAIFVVPLQACSI